MSGSNLWQDLSEIKFRYILLVGAFLIGGTAYRLGEAPDEQDAYDYDDVSYDYDDGSYEYKYDYGDNHVNLNISKEGEAYAEAYVHTRENIRQDVRNGRIEVRKVRDAIKDWRSERTENDDFFDLLDVVANLDWGQSSNDIKRAGDDWEERQAYNSAYIATLESGQTKDEIVNSLGAEDYSRQFDNDIEILMYRTRNRKSDFLTTVDETSPLVFQHDRLIGFTQSDDWADKTRIKADTKTYVAEQAKNSVAISQLSERDNRHAIVEKMGPPDFTDTYAENLEVLSYRTRSVSMDGYTSRDESTSLLLQDGVLLARSIVDQ